MNPRSRILISGAGVGGLACAMWLSRKGFRPVIVEQADSIRAGGFLVSLSHHAYHFAEQLGVMPQLRAHGCGIDSSSYHDSVGRTLLSLQSRALFSGMDVIQLMRDDLVAILYERAKSEIDLRFGDSIQTLNENSDYIDVGFASGRHEKYGVVIGADGLHYIVRKLAFDDSDITYHHLNLNCAAFRLPNILNLRNKFETHMQRDRYMAVFSSGHGDLGAVFVWACDERTVTSGDVRREILQQAFSRGDSSIETVIEQCPTDHSIYMDSLMQVEAKQWCTKRVVIIGDAAHCLTLFSGRGAGAAFNGASRLAQALVELEPIDAFARYQAEMHPVIRAIQPATRRPYAGTCRAAASITLFGTMPCVYCRMHCSIPTSSSNTRIYRSPRMRLITFTMDVEDPRPLP